MVPIVDFLGQPILDRCLGLGDALQPFLFHLGKVLGNDGRHGMNLSLAFDLPVDPGALRPGEDGLWLGLIRRQGPEIKVGGIVDVAGSSGGIHFDVEHALRDDPALACTRDAGVLDGMLEVEEDAWRGPRVALVHEDAAPLEEIAIPLEGEVDDRIEERRAGADEGSQRLPRWRDELLFEGRSFITWQHGFPETDDPVTVAYDRRDV